MKKTMLSLSLAALVTGVASAQVAMPQQTTVTQTATQVAANPYQQAAQVPVTQTTTTVTTPVAAPGVAPAATLPATATMTPAQQQAMMQAMQQQAMQQAMQQQAMQQQAAATVAPVNPPQSLPPLPSDFDLGVQQVMPMTPEEIRLLRRMLDARQKAAAEIPHPPKSVTGSVSVSLDPGSVPAVIRPFFGVSTSLVLVDSTGAPWPVENFIVGNRSLFGIERLDGATGSSFVITPTQTYGQSNLILKLVGHPTPVVINLVSGQKVHDARVEARIMGRGPNAQVTSIPLTQGVDSRLLSVLDGVPPTGRRVSVSGDQSTQAWMMPNGRLWLRTPITLISPAPVSFVSASDGTHVYEIPPTPMILGMMNGQTVSLKVDGCLQECTSSTQVQYDW